MSAELELRPDPNPNLATFEEYYHRRLRLPVHLNFEVQTKLAMFRRLAQKLPSPPEGACVLDLGCGRGGMLFWFPRHCMLGGVDITPIAVEQMRRRARRKGYREFRFECANLERERVPWGDGSADVVVCSHLVEHVQDDRRLLAEISRVLKPGGHLILMIPIHETDRYLNPLHVHRYTESSIEEMLAAHCLRVIAEEADNTLTNLFDRIGGPALPRPLDVLRGKCVGVVGAISLLFPSLRNLRYWGPLRDYGLLARRGNGSAG
jgi:ubiquinone/menaquinone biosynthesis C-methylase UbiE